MAFSDPIATPASGNAYIDGLSWGSHWNDAGSATTTRLAVYIAGTTANEVFDFGGTNVTARTVAQEKAAFTAAFALLANVANLSFSFVTGQSTADIVVGAVNDADAGGGLGVATPPGEDLGPLSAMQGSVIINRDAYSSANYSSLLPGGYDFITFIHEIGHALGLKHPHDTGAGFNPTFPGVADGAEFGDYGDFNLNQGLYTMMSYNDGFETGPNGPLDPSITSGFGWEGTPMALDIAALQYLYGANTSFKTGNDSYTLPASNAAGSFYSCIWDAGGIDTIRTSAATAATIDLRAATLLHAAGGGGFLSSLGGINGGFTIAKGAVIENAIGGAGADKITGNAAANTLSGNAGRDTILGGAGIDRINGGNEIGAGDTLNGEAGNDVVLGNGGDDRLDGGIGADTLIGGAGIDRVNGGAGNDFLDGGGDKDLLTGGAGLDRFDFEALTGTDYVMDFADDQDTLVIDPGFGFASAADVVAATLQSGDYARIVLGGGSQIYLTGFLAAGSGHTIASLLNDILIA